MKRLMTSFIVLIICSVISLAQDVHFSQLNMNQALYHPVSFSISKSDAQLLAAYRTQWMDRSLFRDMMLSYHHSINDFAVGAKIIQNDGGPESIKNSKILLDLSYKRLLNRVGDAIAFGFSGGLIQKRFRPESFQFDNQYVEGQGFDAELLNGETFSNTSQILPVLNAGIFGEKYFSKVKTSLGVSLNNINQPKASFYNNDSNSLIMNYGVLTSVTSTWCSVTNGTIYFIFNKFELDNEWIFGIKINHKIADDVLINFGLANRQGNNFILESGMSFQRLDFALSFDFSSFLKSKIDRFSGIIELSSNYTFVKND